MGRDKICSCSFKEDLEVLSDIFLETHFTNSYKSDPKHQSMANERSALFTIK